MWGACWLRPPSHTKPSSLSDHQNTSCQLFPSPPHPSLHRARERVAWQRRVWIRSRWRRGVTASVSAGTRAFLLSQRPASQNTSTMRTHTHTHTHTHTASVSAAGWILILPCAWNRERGKWKDQHRQTDRRQDELKEKRQREPRDEARQTDTHTHTHTHTERLFGYVLVLIRKLSGSFSLSIPFSFLVSLSLSSTFSLGHAQVSKPKRHLLLYKNVPQVRARPICKWATGQVAKQNMPNCSNHSYISRFIWVIISLSQHYLFVFFFILFFLFSAAWCNVIFRV